jgi:hypothetical protein
LSFEVIITLAITPVNNNLIYLCLMMMPLTQKSLPIRTNVWYN